MTIQELNEWYKLTIRYKLKNVDKSEYYELIRLNHLVMETANAIHNNNMAAGNMFNPFF